MTWHLVMSDQLDGGQTLHDEIFASEEQAKAAAFDLITSKNRCTIEYSHTMVFEQFCLRLNGPPVWVWLLGEAE